MFCFALAMRKCLGGVNWKSVQWTIANQLLLSSGSIAANYAEANNSISKPSFLHKIVISRKEAAESMLWLRLLAATTMESETTEQLKSLHTECEELTSILATILRSSHS